MLAQIFIYSFLAAMLLAAAFDATQFRIPNWLAGGVALGFVLFLPFSGLSWVGMGLHLGAGFVALLLGMALFASGWIGGGDAKLFAAAALWFGWPGLSAFLLATLLAGGALAIVLVMVREGLPRLVGEPGWVEGTLFARGAPVPYGIALAAGALWAAPQSWLAISGI
ncbi:prepilin peptidase [Maricaulis sp.]|uniref:A24 family peptidase n=1 Tax=Maricaulis sp. TaxID=1486257 RepID=UPI00262AB2B0|nr:prepilin peptidase [Maricaulis sp.]